MDVGKKLGRQDREGSGSAQPKEPKKQGRTDREGSGSKQPQQQKSSGKRKPGEIYADAKKMLDKGDWEGPNKLVRGMSKEKRMQRALGTTKNQDERIAAAKAGATNQDFKSNLDRYRKELGQTKPKAKTWVNPDAPKKPGRTDPEGSGSAQPKEPKKPARKLGLSPGAMGGKAKPGLSPGAMGGKVKTKPKVKSKGGDRHPPKMKKKEEGPTEKQVNDWIRSEAPGMRKSYDSFNKVRKSEKIKW